MPGVRVDGMDVEAVYNATKEAIERAKSGNGPTLIECDTYRKYGHFEGDEQKYKTDNDPNKDRDPIIDFREKAIQNGWMTAKEADGIEAGGKRNDQRSGCFCRSKSITRSRNFIYGYLCIRIGGIKNDKKTSNFYDCYY